MLAGTRAPDIAGLVEWLGDKGLKSCIVAVTDIPGKGRGLVVTEDVQPGTSLFTLPDTALLNLRTLRSIYPTLITGGANATGLHASQLLSLHIFLHRPTISGHSTDQHFGPYISSLPVTFDTHPLVWRFRAHDAHAQALLLRLPEPIRRNLEAVWTRFVSERGATAEFLALHCEVLVANSAFRDYDEVHLREALVSDAFLWAWLCVNTRSIYYKVVQSARSPDNVTLCPLLDFANHSQVINSGHSIPTFRAPEVLRQGGEVFLNYGPHPDQTMFIEYGFVTGDPERAHVDLGPEFERLLIDDADHDNKKMQLEQAGYYGDWTMHLTPTPHPSFRTITALRLLCLHDASEDGISAWHKTINGHSATVSADNEASVRSTLVQLCTRIIADCKNSREEVLSGIQDAEDAPDWVRTGLRTICALWDERMSVAKAVLEATERGDEF